MLVKLELLEETEKSCLFISLLCKLFILSKN